MEGMMGATDKTFRAGSEADEVGRYAFCWQGLNASDQVVARKLMHLLLGFRGGRLPTLNSLADLWEFPYSTMLRIARGLRAQGVLAFGRGSPMGAGPMLRNEAVAGRIEEAPPPQNGGEALFREIRDSIHQGLRRRDEPLPKIQYLAVQRHLSNHTIRRVYDRLTEAGLVRRSGKSWLIGSPRKPLRSGIGKMSEFILLLQENPWDWYSLSKASRTQGFCMAFQHEADALRVRVVGTGTNERKAKNQVLWLPGVKAILDFLQSNKDSFLGALLCSPSYESPSLEEWSRILLGFHKPVVWFDRSDNGASQQIAFSPTSFRCRFDVSAAMSLAVETLAEWGHREVGYFLSFSNKEWKHRRLEALRHTASENGLDLRLHCPSSTRDGYSPKEEAHLVERLSEWNGLSVRETRKLFQVAMKRDPNNGLALYEHLIHEPELTAMVAPNDVTGRYLLDWLRIVHVQVPEKFSLLSFDNYPKSWSYPLATIDFGVERLGYFAFHALLGDIPLPKDGNGDIRSIPYLVDRGSLGPPRP